MIFKVENTANNDQTFLAKYTFIACCNVDAHFPEEDGHILNKYCKNAKKLLYPV